MLARNLNHLSLYLETCKDRRFRWGRHDCALFVANGIRAVSGWDPAESWRGYRTKKEALVVMEKAGGLAKLAGKAFGEAHRNVRNARRCDVVLVRLPQRKDQRSQWGECLGLVVGCDVAFAGRVGWVTAPIKSLESCLIWGEW